MSLNYQDRNSGSNKVIRLQTEGLKYVLMLKFTNAILTFFIIHQYKIYPVEVFTLHLPGSHGVTGICFSVHEVEQFPVESACKNKVT